uniref:Uncharacterized protein n=1 Tax=Ascaris lumbricoides TaxID=6252 RepID=A0A0M3HPL2_ASCLU
MKQSKCVKRAFARSRVSRRDYGLPCYVRKNPAWRGRDDEFLYFVAKGPADFSSPCAAVQERSPKPEPEGRIALIMGSFIS